jgi:hypothetical protein
MIMFSPDFGKLSINFGANLMPDEKVEVILDD